MGVLVKTVRVQKALSQEDLARLAGVRAATISDIEHGKTQPRPSTIRALASALGVPPERLTVGAA